MITVKGRLCKDSATAPLYWNIHSDFDAFIKKKNKVPMTKKKSQGENKFRLLTFPSLSNEGEKNVKKATSIILGPIK